MKNNKGFTLLELMICFVVTFIIIIFMVITTGVIGMIYESTSNTNHNTQIEIHESVKPEVNKKL